MGYPRYYIKKTFLNTRGLTILCTVLFLLVAINIVLFFTIIKFHREDSMFKTQAGVETY